MPWEAFTAAAAIITVLVMIRTELRNQNKLRAQRVKEETEEKERMESRVGTLEKEFRGLSDALADHMQHTSDALEALKTEMPIAMANAVTRAIASTIEMQQNAYTNFLESLTERLRNGDKSPTAGQHVTTKPRTNRKRA